ncbi:peptidylprolyl isomerase [Adhaeribacter aquaticus]|uniref:peptidylprolyl isomerase n=1 Tax=Adhaeribacter aquaticus TaxID=299567 RepID=UPI00040EF14F|nr:peptidylprolyl isomerase [Adhaeribacter aquaticus]
MKFKVYPIYILAWFITPVFGQQQPVNKFQDTTLRSIFNYQDERQTDNLLPYLKNPSSTDREEAALAFGSVQDKKAIPFLEDLLTDKKAEVRKAAAYSLGQLADKTSEANIIKAIQQEKQPEVRAELLEALGKCATQTGIDFLSTFNSDSLLEQTGQAWGLYRANAKNLDYDKAIPKAIYLLNAVNKQAARLGAAHFLARTPNLNLFDFTSKLSSVASTDPSPDVRMAAVQTLGKILTDEPILTLQNLAQQDPDYRVRINALRALGNRDYAKVKQTIYRGLSDKNIHTATAAADLLLAKAPLEDSARLLTQAKQDQRWRVRATLLAAALKNASNKTPVNNLILKHYNATNNNYEKGFLLAALSQDLTNFRFIEKETFAKASPILASYGIQALADSRKNKDFLPSLVSTFASIFKRAIESGDVALIGITAGLLQEAELNFKESFPDYAFLIIARDKLKLPQDMETYQELQKTINFFEGKAPAEPPKNPYTHPINWVLIQKLKPNQQVLLKTNKGNITLQLFTEEAPGTVANFVELIQKGFYNNKSFHRVVPNFVVQGGDPRGDGWGGTDYAIRSELANLRYAEGYVGMASAGKDTESCQWFITHSPTPHLDGRYTIFAKVLKGLPVVHALEIGDIIQTVTLLE